MLLAIDRLQLPSLERIRSGLAETARLCIFGRIHTLSMTFNALYNRASSLATISGNFAEATIGMVFSVNGTGVVFAQDATSGRVISGTVSIINASYNAYSVTISYASCQGQYAILNGAQLTGLGTLDNTVAPERGVVGVSGTAGATKVAIVETLNRT